MIMDWAQGIARIIDTCAKVYLHHQGQNYQKERFAEEKKFQLEQSQRRYEEQVKLALLNYEAARSNKEWEFILRNFPLTLMPSQVKFGLENLSELKRLPLTIILAPPDVRSEPFPDDSPYKRPIPPIGRKIEDRLREFLSDYPQTSPIDFLGGTLVSQKFHGEALINVLYTTFPSIPILVLESEWNDNLLNFRVAFWQAGHEKTYQQVFSIPYHEVLCEYAREDAIRWREERKRLLNSGIKPEVLGQFGKEAEVNLEVLTREEILRHHGIGKSQDDYKISKEHWTRFQENVISCHCIIAGWIADVYHLVSQSSPPQLPVLLPKLLNSNSFIEINYLKDLIKEYQTAYGAYMPSWMPELHLNLAFSLLKLTDKRIASEQIDKAITSWAELQNTPSSESDSLNNFLLALAEENYLQANKLRESMKKIGDHRYDQVNQILENWYKKQILGENNFDKKGPML